VTAVARAPMVTDVRAELVPGDGHRRAAGVLPVSD